MNQEGFHLMLVRLEKSEARDRRLTWCLMTATDMQKPGDAVRKLMFVVRQ